jgi:hypothetical protein
MTDHRIATTMRPDQVVWVNDAELIDLQRLGVVDRVVPYSLDDVPAPIQIPPEVEDDSPQEEPEADGELAPEAEA